MKHEFLGKTKWMKGGQPSILEGVRTLGKRRALDFAVLILLLGPRMSAQTAAPVAEGVDRGNYHYQGSFELGYRFTNTNGNSSVYDTYVNQQQGPRLFSQTLGMRALNHEGMLFDNLDLSSFGWGGDPENATRMRMSKDKWYDFSLMFRRDQNFWDYNLLANPLNPVNPVIQVNNTPHQFQTTRRMYDYGLTLFPQSMFRFRLGYSRDNMEGPAMSSVHEGTDTQLLQTTRTLLNAYRIGVDFRGLPRTSISYDQFLQYYKGDTSWLGQPGTLPLSDGTLVDPGIIYNTAASQPCATPILATVPPTYNPACNGYQFYSRAGNSRVAYPTEQLALQSSYFRHLDLSARASYSAVDGQLYNFNELFAGLITRTRQRAFGASGPASSRRVVVNTDMGATLHVTDRLRVIDTFRFSNFRVPGSWNLTTASLFGATLLSTPNVFSPATCPPPFTAATCPQHSASSSADVVQDFINNFLRQDAKINTTELEYDVTRKLSGHVGFRFERRSIVNNSNDVQAQTFYPSLPNRGACVGQPLAADGSCSVLVPTLSNEALQVNGYSFLFGVTARPSDALRTSFDLELFSADKAETRISPRNLQHYKGRVGYKPAPWANLSGTVNVLEDRNNEDSVFHKEHNRNYGFSLMLDPQPKFGVEFGYNYDDVYSTTNICYVATPPPPGAATCGTPFLQAPSIYDNQIHFGYVNLTFRPVKRVTTYLGYNLTSTAGETLILTPTETSMGPLAFNFHRPTASVDIDLAKGMTWRTAWNYHDYNEKSDPALVAGRDFQSNSAILSLLYAF